MKSLINSGTNRFKNTDEAFLEYLKHDLRSNTYWDSYLKKIGVSEDAGSLKIHLAVFIEPFLQYVIDGKKTIESRFSINKCAPFNKVSKGDIVLVKKSGGPIVAVCRISERWYYNLDPNSWAEIKKYKEALCAHDPDFWRQKKNASYATLMKIGNVTEISPLFINKKDRRGWVVINRINDKQYTLM